MSKKLFNIGLSVVFVFMVGCGGSRFPPPPSATISGTAVCDGTPIDDGEITFTCEGLSPMVIFIKGGKFEGLINPGKNRVQIRGYREGKPYMMKGQPVGDPPKLNYVSEEFNEKSEQYMDIDEGMKGLMFEVAEKKKK